MAQKLILAREIAHIVDRVLTLVDTAGAKQATAMALAAAMAKYCDRSGIPRDVFCGLIQMTPKEDPGGR